MTDTAPTAPLPGPTPSTAAPEPARPPAPLAGRDDRAGDPAARRRNIAVLGGVLGALGASSCCIVPLLLFSAGLGGAWLGNLTQLAPYKPVFVTVALGFLGWGFWQVYRRPRSCQGGSCARPLPGLPLRIALWSAALLTLTALFWTWIAPVVAPLLLGL